MPASDDFRDDVGYDDVRYGDVRYGDVRQNGVRGARPPLFPGLMTFPASCFILTLVTDIIYARSYNVSWETFSVWLLTFGLLAALPFVVVGLLQALVRGVWPSRISRIGYAIVLILSIFNVFIHSRDGYTAVVPSGITLSAVVVLILFAMWIIDYLAAPRRRVRG